MKQITPMQLKEKLESNKITLIDVREANEIQICNIKDSVFIPMNEIPNQINKLSKENSYAVICHTGVRSGYVCSYMNNEGYKVQNVQGGIHEWANTVDVNMKKY